MRLFALLLAAASLAASLAGSALADPLTGAHTEADSVEEGADAVGLVDALEVDEVRCR